MTTGQDERNARGGDNDHSGSGKHDARGGGRNARPYRSSGGGHSRKADSNHHSDNRSHGTGKGSYRSGRSDDRRSARDDARSGSGRGYRGGSGRYRDDNRGGRDDNRKGGYSGDRRGGGRRYGNNRRDDDNRDGGRRSGTGYRGGSSYRSGKGCPGGGNRGNGGGRTFDGARDKKRSEDRNGGNDRRFGSDKSRKSGGDRDRKFDGGRSRDGRRFDRDRNESGQNTHRKPRVQDRVASSIAPDFTYAGPMGVEEYHAHRDEIKAREGKRLGPTREETERMERRMREAAELAEENNAAQPVEAADGTSEAEDSSADRAPAATNGQHATAGEGTDGPRPLDFPPSDDAEEVLKALDGIRTAQGDATAAADSPEGASDIAGAAGPGQDSERYGGKRSKSILGPYEDLPRRVRSNPKVTPARIAAYLVGREVRERDAYVSAVIPKVFAAMGNTLTPIDAGFATKLARGVMSTLGTLDEVINRNIKHADDLRGEVRDAIRVSTYELMYLGKESYVVTDQGVELVRFFEPKAAGLANAVLHRITRDIRDFPYGNPATDDRAFARQHAFPLWMAKRLISQMGRDEAGAFMDATNTDATVYVGVNRAKATDQEVLDVFAQAEEELVPQEDVPGCYLMKSGRALRNDAVRGLISEGKMLISDKAAQKVALFALPEEEPSRMLEVGAGRGTKTILLESNAIRAWGHTVPMTSVDNLEFKHKVLEDRLKTYGIDNVTPLTADGRRLADTLEPESFEAVFIDAPCSGTGTMRRHPEIRWRLRSSAVEQLAGLEQEILSECSKLVAPGGQLVYATCSVLIEENERVIERFLKSMRGEGFKPEAMMTTTLTAGGPDAHFAIRLRRVK